MNDPDRLLTKGADDDLARLLQVAEKDVLDDEGMSKLRMSLSATLGAASIGSGASGAVKAGRGWLGLKLAIPLVLGGALVAGVHYRHASQTRPPAPVVAAPALAPSVSESTPPELVAPLSANALPSAPSAPVPTHPPPPRSLPSSSPRDGLLLLQARRSLETDPQRTLDLVRQHEREFPQSQLVPERDKLRAEATARGAK